MTKFTVKLAGIPIGITPLYDRTRMIYRDYLTEETPLFSLKATEDGLAQEREMTDRHKNLVLQNYSASRAEAELESQWLYHQIGDRLPAYGALLVHGSAVEVDGEAYLFTAPSGTGKSTHARLWRQYFGARAVMINDDKPLLKFKENGVQACGSPWRGKHRLGTNTSAPLKGVCLLTRGEGNSIIPVTAEEAFPTLLQQCYFPADPQRLAQTLTLADTLARNVPHYRLTCNQEPEAAVTAYQGMNGGVDK